VTGSASFQMTLVLGRVPQDKHGFVLDDPD